jgi:hypothetical protein
VEITGGQDVLSRESEGLEHGHLVLTSTAGVLRQQCGA